MREKIILCQNGPGTHESIWLLRRLKVPLDIPQHGSGKLTGMAASLDRGMGGEGPFALTHLPWAWEL